MRLLHEIRPVRIAALRFAVLAVLVMARPAAAHEYWLAPSRYVAAAGQPVDLGALAGTGFRGERKPFTASHCVRLSVRAARPLDLMKVARDGEYTWARFAPADTGGAVFAFESDFTPITLPAAAFDDYLAKEGLDGPLAARRRMDDANSAGRPGRERFRRCAKAWLAGGDAARATAPIGLPLEIVPLEAPGKSGLLRLRVLWQGQPLAGALVRAWRAPVATEGALTDPESRDSCVVAWQARTNARGEALAAVAGAGEWLIAAVHMVPSSDTAVADWESTWASLTFERAAAAATALVPPRRRGR